MTCWTNRYEPDGLGWTPTADGRQMAADAQTRIYALSGVMFDGAGGVPPCTNPTSDSPPKCQDPPPDAGGTQAGLGRGQPSHPGPGQRDGTITRAYDGLDRLTSETTAQGAVSYTYDNASRPLTMSAPSQAQVSYIYDNADRLEWVAQGSVHTSISYDADNRRYTMTLPNGLVVNYRCDGASQLTSITYLNGSTTIGTLTYTYDKAGRIASRGGTLFQSVLPAAVASASYDLANRLTARTAAGSTINPSWDLNGNLIGDGLRSYTWDARNRLTAIPGVASYGYDAFGRRNMKTPGGGTATAYLYDRADIAQEQQGGAASANLLASGNSVDERFTRTTTGTGGATATYLLDALGSTMALSDSTGTVQTSYGYDPYGVSSTSGTASDNPYQFTGRENDGTGLYFNRARYYNPAWGRFISEDPIGLAGGINRYTYAGGNPVSLRDPGGNNPLAGAIGGAELGGFIGGPWGAAAGAIIGGGIGLFGGCYLIGCGNGDAGNSTATPSGLKNNPAANNGAPPNVLMNQSNSGEAGPENDADDPNKVSHVSDNPGHNLDPVLQQFPSAKDAYSALQEATQAVVDASGTMGKFEQQVQVGNVTVTLRGAVVGGVARIGTAFVP